MCARFYTLEAANYIARLRLEAMRDREFRPHYNAAPTHRLPVVRLVEGKRRLEESRWGWRAPWLKGVMPNARGEEAHAKRTFAAGFRERRCIVPMSGFYEWETIGRDKLPWAFQQQSGEPLFVAGLWEPAEPEDGTASRFLLMTCAAIEPVATIHDRMPVILPTDEAISMWLDPELPEPAVRSLVAPHEGLVRRRVSKLVNNVRNNGPELHAEEK